MDEDKTILASNTVIQNVSENQPTDANRADGLESRPMDINSATSEQLRRLVGIGIFYANRIVKGRPYHESLDLVHKRILPVQTYNRMKDEIVVGAWNSRRATSS